MFGEAMMSSVTGAKPSSAAKKSELAVQPDNTYRPGIVSVVDLQKVNGDTVSIATQKPPMANHLIQYIDIVLQNM